MVSDKIKIALIASSLFLASYAYSDFTNVNARIEQNLSGLTNIAQNARGWKIRKEGDSRAYTTLQADDFVFLKINTNGLQRMGYVGNDKVIWDDNREGFGLSAKTDAFEEITRTNRAVLSLNPSVENVARVNEEYLSILERLNSTLDKTPKSSFRRWLDGFRE